jgi:hypothetical protein
MIISTRRLTVKLLYASGATPLIDEQYIYMLQLEAMDLEDERYLQKTYHDVSCTNYQATAGSPPDIQIFNSESNSFHVCSKFFFSLSSHLTVESLNKISGKSISPKPLQRAMCGMYLAFRKRMRPFCALTTRRITFLWRECIWRALVADHLSLSWVIGLWQLPSECTGHGGNDLPIIS